MNLLFFFRSYFAVVCLYFLLLGETILTEKEKTTTYKQPPNEVASTMCVCLSFIVRARNDFYDFA